MRTYKIARVTWDDISCYHGWRDIENTKDCDPLQCVSVGTLVEVKKGNVGLMQSVSGNDNGSEITVIPKRVIRRMKIIDKFEL